MLKWPLRLPAILQQIQRRSEPGPFLNTFIIHISNSPQKMFKCIFIIVSKRVEKNLSSLESYFPSKHIPQGLWIYLNNQGLAWLAQRPEFWTRNKTKTKIKWKQTPPLLTQSEQMCFNKFCTQMCSKLPFPECPAMALDALSLSLINLW